MSFFVYLVHYIHTHNLLHIKSLIFPLKAVSFLILNSVMAEKYLLISHHILSHGF
jgi:hypothetical protein